FSAHVGEEDRFGGVDRFQLSLQNAGQAFFVGKDQPVAFVETGLPAISLGIVRRQPIEGLTGRVAGGGELPLSPQRVGEYRERDAVFWVLVDRPPESVLRFRELSLVEVDDAEVTPGEGKVRSQLDRLPQDEYRLVVLLLLVQRATEVVMRVGIGRAVLHRGS